MKNPIKRLAIFCVAILVCSALVSLYLAPTAPQSPANGGRAEVDPTVGVIRQAATSTLQSVRNVAVSTAMAAPKVGWAPDSVATQLVRGQTKSIAVSFTANQAIDSVTVRVVPALAPFVEVSPSSLANIAKGASVSLTISVSASATSSLGTVEGVIQLREGSGSGRTVAKPLPISIAIGDTVTGVIPGMTFRMPPAWAGTFIDTSVDFLSPETRAQMLLPDAAEIPADVALGVRGNPENLTLKNFIDEYRDGWFTVYNQRTEMQIAGRNAILVSNVNRATELAPATVLFLSLPSGQILLIELPRYPSALTPEILIGFEQIVKSLQF